MRDSRLRLLVLTMGVICLVLAARPALTSSFADTTPQQSTEDQGTLPKPIVNPDGYTAARVCGRCHVDIYNSWKRSMHSFSLTNPIFDTAYMQALKKIGEEAKQTCLPCHAPMTMFNGDFDLKEGVTREGVSCDFCHTVTAVHINNLEAPYEIELGIVKRGIIKHAGSPVHETAYSPLHGTSEFCGGCHNYVLANGVRVMSTYEEWLSGPYADEGIQCQDCHMTLGEGSRVSSDIKDTGREFHLHSLIHDTDQLKSALELEITEMIRTGGRLQVQVRVENSGSGHMIPTGIPSREVVLVVICDAGNTQDRQERRYSKVLEDADGRLLSNDYEIMVNAAKVTHDNRIKPREVRIETFNFRLPRSRPAKITAHLYYMYSPMILDKARFDIEMAQVEKRVR